MQDHSTLAMRRLLPFSLQQEAAPQKCSILLLQVMHQHCTIAMELLSALVLGAGQGLMCVLAMAAGGRGGHHLLKMARAVL